MGNANCTLRNKLYKYFVWVRTKIIRSNAKFHVTVETSVNETHINMVYSVLKTKK